VITDPPTRRGVSEDWPSPAFTNKENKNQYIGIVCLLGNLLFCRDSSCLPGKADLILKRIPMDAENEEWNET
jgi:hypothetical protein